MKSYCSIFVALALIAPCVMASSPTRAQETDEEIVTPAHTVEAFRAKARIYLSKAAGYRKEAERHKEVARRFREERDAKGRPANTQSDIQEMDKRCKALSEHAATLAKDAELLADFYERHANALAADGGATPAKPPR